jgi:hypothetical protein
MSKAYRIDSFGSRQAETGTRVHSHLVNRGPGALGHLNEEPPVAKRRVTQDEIRASFAEG